MSRKIIVAGAGHGGLAAAALLAKKGFDVTVYERKSEGTLGYDWTDIFAPRALNIAGMDLPPEDKYEYKENMTFYSPDMKKGLRQDVAPDQLEIKMERSDIYAHLISYAVNCGAKIEYDCCIKAPIMLGSRVCGISTDKGDFYGDLVIDAAGIDSPVRSNLPVCCGIEKKVKPYEQFYVYRAFYNRASDEEPQDKYKVCLLPQGKLGVGWVATEKEYTDLLIGRFKPFDMSQVEETAAFFRETNPTLGDKVCRGGQFVKIPVRHPLNLMVCDGYAAIGDSAFMTVPVIGSGIANSLKAAKMLADTVVADRSFEFTAEKLWSYQKKYYKQLGAGLSVLACVKLLLTQLRPEELDFMFETGILTAKDLTIGADSTSLSSMLNASFKELTAKAKSLCKDPALLAKIAATGVRIARVTASNAAMPAKWNTLLVRRWANARQNCFKRSRG